MTLRLSLILACSCGAPPAPIATKETTSREALVALAQSGAYRDWPAEPAPHASAGPHGKVRTWLNPTLRDSVKSAAASHPTGSIAVKELYADDDSLRGWAIDVKRDDGEWVFFEGFLPALNQYYFVSTGNLCASCHDAGVDYLLTPAAAIP